MRKLDSREMRFCELIVQGLEAPSAYLEAGFPGPSGLHAVNQAKKMMQDPDVKRFLEELNAPQPGIGEPGNIEEEIDTAAITRELILRETWKSYKKAVLLGQMPAAFKALEMLGSEAAGMFKKETAKSKDKGGGKSIKEMSIQELQDAILRESNESQLPRA